VGRKRQTTVITYFVHAASTDTGTGIRSGWSDPPLSANGVRQATELRDLIADQRFELVFASDSRRAVATAKLAFPYAMITADPRLREMNYGVLNGRPATDFGDDHTFVEQRYPGGECCLDVEQRVRTFLRERCDSAAYVAIVAHRFPQLALDVICGGMDWHAALERDWRRVGAWQPGWNYELPAKLFEGARDD
jgi:probable phosphoglycerate mutase